MIKVITVLDVCTNNFYGHWKNGVYYAGIGDIGKKCDIVNSSIYINKQEQSKKKDNINKRKCYEYYKMV